MATCIQLASHRGEDFTSRGSALPDSLPARASSCPLHEKQSPQNLRRKKDAQITKILDLIESCEAWNILRMATDASDLGTTASTERPGLYTEPHIDGNYEGYPA